MKIQIADQTEASEISRFVSELSATHIGPTLGTGGLEKLLASMDTDSTIQRMTEGYPHWIAVDGGEMIGVAVVKPPSHIYHLFVSSNRQRNGIGRLLLNEALQYISDTSNSPLITVNSSLNAADAYRRFGFAASEDPKDDGGVRYLPMCLEHGDASTRIE